MQLVSQTMASEKEHGFMYIFSSRAFIKWYLNIKHILCYFLLDSCVVNIQKIVYRFVRWNLFKLSVWCIWSPYKLTAQSGFNISRPKCDLVCLPWNKFHQAIYLPLQGRLLQIYRMFTYVHKDIHKKMLGAAPIYFLKG